MFSPSRRRRLQTTVCVAVPWSTKCPVTLRTTVSPSTTAGAFDAAWTGGAVDREEEGEGGKEGEGALGRVETSSTPYSKSWWRG